MGFSRQEYWSGLPFPSPGDLPQPGIEPMSLASPGRFFTTEPPGKPSSQSRYLEIRATDEQHSRLLKVMKAKLAEVNKTGI